MCSYPLFKGVKTPEALKVSIPRYSGKIDLYWVRGAGDRFRIYRSDSESGSYQQIAETGDIFYTDQ